MPDPIAHREALPAFVDAVRPEVVPPTPETAPLLQTTEDFVRLVQGAEAARAAVDYRRFAEAQRSEEKAARPTAREVGMCKSIVSNPVKALAIVGAGAVGVVASPNKAAGGIGGAAVGAIVGGLVGDAAAAIVCDPPGTK